MNVLVKFIGIGNAGGELGEPIAVIAIPSMDENVFFAERVKTFSTSSFTEGGWIYCAKKRSGTPEMWRHFFTNVVVGSIKQSRETHRHKVMYHILIIKYL